MLRLKKVFHFRKLFILIPLFLLGCGEAGVAISHDSCSSTVSYGEVDSASTTVQVSGGGVLGQHIRVDETIFVKRIMLRLSSSGVTSMILSITEDFDPSEQGKTVTPMASMTISQSFGTAQLTDIWFELPEPVELKGGVQYVIGFAPNSPMNVVWASTEGSGLRTGYYRTGAAPSQYGDAVQGRQISIALEGDLDCLQ